MQIFVVYSTLLYFKYPDRYHRLKDVSREGEARVVRKWWKVKSGDKFCLDRPWPQKLFVGLVNMLNHCNFGFHCSCQTFKRLSAIGKGFVISEVGYPRPLGWPARGAAVSRGAERSGGRGPGPIVVPAVDL